MATEAREQLQILIGSLADELKTLSGSENWDQGWMQQTLRLSVVLQSLVNTAGISLGECRKSHPYAPLKPVIDSNGKLIWCCEHDPSHCAS